MTTLTARPVQHIVSNPSTGGYATPSAPSAQAMPNGVQTRLGFCPYCGYKMVEPDGESLWWLDENNKRTGDAFSIFGNKVSPMHCRRCQKWSVLKIKGAQPAEIYACIRIVVGRNSRLPRHTANAPP